jgi:hypothetical protein
MPELTLTDEKRHLAAIIALQRECDVAESDYEQAKDEASALKKVWEAKAKKLFEYNRALSKPLPLFEVWRQTPVAELGLSEGVVGILSEHGLDTVGKLADYTAAGKKLTDLPHMGEKKAESVTAALERFWREHPSEDATGHDAPPAPDQTDGGDEDGEE